MPALGADDVLAAIAGGPGTVNAKLRLMTSQLNDILTSVEEVTVSGMLQTAAVATGSGTIVDLRGVHQFMLHITGISTATVTFQGSIDGSNWVNVAMRNTTSTAAATLAVSATADGAFVLPIDYALGWFRANITVWSGGTINVVYRLVDNFAWGH